ncbi:MAG: DUF481 domain-containing protein [Robiginitomaculum sp.]|nr:DUF481 domain-containing protein [Robiginitomaculum sp.]
MRKLLLGCIVFIGFSPAALAQNWTDGWGGEASLSGSQTTGNTDTTDIGIALRLSKTNGPWKSKFDTTYDLGQASGVNNQNRWTIGYQLDRKISEKMYVYGNADYFTDDFGPFKQGSFFGTGLGFQAIETEQMNWAVETGVGYRSQRSRGVGIIFPVTENEVALRGGSNFTYQLNDAVSFFNNSEVIWSDSDTYLWNDIGITAQVAGNLSARFNFRVDHHTSVPFGIENTDTITRIALVYTL